MAKYSIINAFLALCLSCTFSVSAIFNITNPTSAVNAPKLEFLTNYSGDNQIKILNNRFRVDYHVDEMMLLFFRKHGSTPIVLVQPDGSKIYSKDANINTIEWHADTTYDLIKLKNPMAGPWQAVGRILPESKILVLSDIELEADAFPQQVFQHEVIKAQAKVINASAPITSQGFREVVKLRASLYPSKDPTKENFGSDIYQFGEFLDNGKGLDERPKDGVFTIEYKINTAYGEWIPNYRVNAALFSRELEQPPIYVMPSPVQFIANLAKEDENGEQGRYHYVAFDVDDSHLDNFSLLFQGIIHFPNGDQQTFSIDGQQARSLEIFNGEFGRFKVKMNVFGTTKEGREFQMDIPEFQFVTIEPEIVELNIPEMTELPQDTVKNIKPKEPDFPVILIVLVNTLILILGFLVIWLFVLKRTIKNPFAGLLKKKVKAVPETEIKPQAKKEEPVKKSPIVDSSDDILDLSLPED